MGLQTFEDWRLVIGSHLSNGMALLLCFVAVAAMAIFAWDFFRQEKRRRPPGLLVLRFFAIAACLVAALQPFFELREVTRIPNHIAVLIDGSRSMSVALTEPTNTRAHRANVLWQNASSQIANWRNKGHRIDLYQMAEELTPARASDLANPPKGQATRMGEALSQIKSRYAGRDLGAVVVVSDGVDTGRIGAGPLDGESQAVIKALKVPINTVMIGEPVLRDLSVATVLADDFAFVRTPIKLEAVIRHSGLGGRHVEVTLKRDGHLVDAHTVALTGDASESRVTFPFTPQKPGNVVFEIDTPVLKGEALASNNRQVFTLKVIRDRVRVLHVTGRPSWDVRFLRSLMRLDPNVDLVSFFILRTRGDEQPHDISSEMALIPFPYAEIFSEQLHSFDLLVFHNFNYRDYDVARFLPGVRDYVTNGGALAMIGGDLSFAAGDYARSALADVLPVDLSTIATRGVEGFALGEFSPALTTEGLTHPITSLSLDPQTNKKLWQGLPPLDGVNRVTGLQPGAIALMTHPKIKNADGSPGTVLAVSDVGKGRTLAVTTDTTWNWGFGAAGQGDDGRTFQRFWEGAIRWLVRDPSLTLLRADLDKVEYHEGSAIHVRVRAVHGDYTPAANVKVTLDILPATSDDEQSQAQDKPIKSLEVTTSTEGDAHVEIPAMAQGSYRLRASAHIDGQDLQDVQPLIVRPEGREMNDVVARADVLKALAQQSGGHFSADPTLDNVVVLPLREERLGRREAVEFGQHPFMLALALVLLCAEWYWRRRLGLR